MQEVQPEILEPNRQTSGATDPDSVPDIGKVDIVDIPDEITVPPEDTIPAPGGEPAGNPAISPIGREGGYQTVPII